MNTRALLLYALLALSVSHTMSAADEIVPLVPGAILRFECPELPPTLMSLHTKTEEVPRVTVRLPLNYSAEKNYPLFIWIDGGNGGDARGAGSGRQIMQDRDFLFVKLPIFKRELNSTAFSVLYVSTRDDGEILSHAYRTLLERVYENIPNIDTANNVIGGFSNGGNAIAAVVNTGDPWLMQRLYNILFVEGGQQLVGRENKSIAGRNVIILFGDGEGRESQRAGYTWMHERAIEGGANSTLFGMPDTAHTFPTNFHPVVRNWVYEATASESQGESK